MDPMVMAQRASSPSEGSSSPPGEMFKVIPECSMMSASPCGLKGQEESENKDSSGSWLRARNRDEELRKYFDLPVNESLMDDFHCALRKRILLQGRMYIFEHHVCFYSNVLGFVKKRVIQLKDVANVKKKTNFRFPNSIEIEVRGQRRDFYTSFLSRDDAFTLIYNAWQQSRASNADLDAGTTSCHARRSTSSIRRVLSHDAAGDSETDGKMLDPSIGKSHTEGIEGMLSRSSSGNAGKSHSYDDDDGCSDRDEEEEEEEGPLVWLVQDREVPTVPKTCKLVVAVDLSCGVHDFFDRIMSNDSHFIEDFHSSQGDRRILLTSWRADERMGHVRELQFITPIKSAFANWGTTHTQCHQTQRFAVYPGDRVLFESSQVMTDIPYGDYFSVDTRWDVMPSPTDASHCSIKIYLHCIFTKKCMVRSIIENGSFKQTQEMFQLFFQQVKQVITKPKPLTAINIRDKSFVIPQPRIISPSTPKDRPVSPNANHPSTSLSRPPSVLHPANQATSSRPDQTCTNPSLNNMPHSSNAGVSSPPRMQSADPQVHKPAVLQLPPRSRSSSAGKEVVCKRTLAVQERTGTDVGNRATTSGILEAVTSAFQSCSTSTLLLSAVVLQLLFLLLVLWRWRSTPHTEVQQGSAVQRLALLQQEIKLLQLRMELVTAEMSNLAQQLGGGAAAAAGVS